MDTVDAIRTAGVSQLGLLTEKRDEDSRRREASKQAVAGVD